MTMLTTANTTREFDVSSRSAVEIADFKQLVNSASTAAAGLPLTDLPKAFQLSFSLIEKVSDLMLSAFMPAKKEDGIETEALEECSSSKLTNPCTDAQSERLVHSGTLIEETEFPKHVLCSRIKNKSENQKSSDTNGGNFPRELDKQSKTAPSFSNGTKSSDCGHIENNGIRRRPHSTNSSASSCLSSSENQPHFGDLVTDEGQTLTLVGSDSETGNKRQKFGEDSKIDAEVSGEQALDSTDSEQCNTESRISKSFGSFPSGLGSTRGSTTHDHVQGMRSPADLRRWRLSSTDRLNTLIDECERQIHGRKLYVCKFCGKVYEIKSSMRYHMKIIHLQMHLRTTEMQCRICGKQFTCVSAVNRHQSKCMLSTYTENGMHRSKNYPFSLSGVACSTVSHTDIPSTNCSNSVPTMESTDIDGDLRTISETESKSISARQNVTSSAFHNLPSSCTPMDTALHNVTFSATSKSIFPRDNLGMMDLTAHAAANTNCCFPPTYPTRSYSGINPTPSDLNMDSYWNATNTPIPWPSFPNLSYNLSEMTPVQLEMCMKAVVRGIHSNLTGIGSTMPITIDELPNSQPKQSTSPSATSSDIPTVSDLHCSSFSSTQTNTLSEISDGEATFSVIKEDEVAIDLSARSHTDSLMIESF